MRKTIAGALLAGAIAATGLAAGVAQAEPFSAQAHSWCPGNGLPYRGIEWNMGVCHTSFVLADVPAPVFNPPPPPPPPPPPEPPHPFCTPRGGLFIIGPICDEIGVHR